VHFSQANGNKHDKEHKVSKGKKIEKKDERAVVITNSPIDQLESRTYTSDKIRIRIPQGISRENGPTMLSLKKTSLTTMPWLDELPATSQL
jgi:hypothetical protein